MQYVFMYEKSTEPISQALCFYCYVCIGESYFSISMNLTTGTVFLLPLVMLYLYVPT